MKILIEYKSDHTPIPFCAQTRIDGKYYCQWSSKSFEDARDKLLADIQSSSGIQVPKPEEIEI